MLGGTMCWLQLELGDSIDNCDICCGKNHRVNGCLECEHVAPTNALAIEDAVVVVLLNANSTNTAVLS